MFDYGQDPEKVPQVHATDNTNLPSFVDADNAVPGETFEYGNSWYARVQRLAGKLKIEQRGIERVPEYERSDNSMLNVGTMWLAANMVQSAFAIGCLGNTIFYLGFVDSILVILFFNLLGILPVCFFSTFGPLFGLRQMVLSRYWFGWHPVKLICVFNVLACIGWSSVNVIVGAQLINTVNSNVPGYAGILIIALCTFIITCLGYKVVHLYEFYSWIPAFIVFMIVLGEFAAHGDFINLAMGSGAAETGSVLSFGSVVFGFATGWTSYAADYTVYQPSNAKRRSVFFWTWLGLIFPLLFCQMLGAAVITATGTYGLDTTIPGSDPNNPYLIAYNTAGPGGLIGEAIVPHLGNFGNFCLIILALSIIANNCPNIYSVALTVQVLGKWTQMIPRFIWTGVGTGVYIAIAIPGYFHFETVLETFMNFIGYWLAIYEGISLPEHFVFRRGFAGYEPAHYDQPDKLPVGLAAFASFCIGVVGMVMGMSQKWYVGPIAIRIGEPPFGGDVGFELAFGFAAVAYLCLRPLELKFLHR